MLRIGQCQKRPSKPMRSGIRLPATRPDPALGARWAPVQSRERMVQRDKDSLHYLSRVRRAAGILGRRWVTCASRTLVRWSRACDQRAGPLFSRMCVRPLSFLHGTLVNPSKLDPDGSCWTKGELVGRARGNSPAGPTDPGAIASNGPRRQGRQTAASADRGSC
jgi:hypothetical protein